MNGFFSFSRSALATVCVVFTACGPPDARNVDDIVDEPTAPPLEFQCNDIAPVPEAPQRCVAGDVGAPTRMYDPCGACWREPARVGCVDGDGHSLDIVFLVRREDGALFQALAGSMARELVEEQPDHWLITTNLIAPTSDRPCLRRFIWQ